MATPLRILLLEDDPSDASLVQAMLDRAFECLTVTARTGAEFTAALEGGGFDLILSDFRVPGFDGMAALACVRERAPDLPFIFVSGTVGEETAVDAIKAGATDYVHKERLARLVPAINRALQEEQECFARRKAGEQLQLAKETAEAASRAKSEFLANVSHEIRTPLNGILGFTDLCLETELSDLQRDYLRQVKRSSIRLLGVIRDILDISRIEAGRNDLPSAPFRLRDAVAEAMDGFFPQAREKELGLSLTVADEVPDEIIGDPERLRRIVGALVGNAVKFTIQGEIGVSVGVEEGEDESATIRVSVRDTGIGIAPEHSAMIFDPFTQVDGSSTRRFGGIGLGLAIARRLVELSGGAIWVESEPGCGSTFHVSIPFGLPPADRMDGEERD